jgi:hypothetical protein
MLKRNTRFAGAVSAAISLLVATSVLNAGEMNDLNDFSCKDVMRLSGEERDISIAFVQGYMLGKSKDTKYDIEKLAGITDAFIDYCLDHPSEKALTSFEKVYE